MAGWQCIGQTLAASSSIAFDPAQDLIWTGSPGAVQSLFLPGLGPRYTAFKNAGASPVNTILLDDKGVCTINEQSAKYSNRRGLCAWQILARAEQIFTCAIHTNAQGAEVLLGSASTTSAFGQQPDLQLVSTSTGSIIRKVESTEPLSHFARGSHMIASASSRGRIHLRDPRALTVQHALEGHTAGITNLEAEGHLLISTGFSVKTNAPQAYNTPDPLVKVYDIRNLRPLAPLPFPSGPAFVKIHPRSTSTLILSNLHGAFQIVDMSNPSTVQFYQTEVPSYLTSMAIAPTGEALAFGDADGGLSLWAMGDDAKFSRFQGEIELPDPVDPPKQVAWSDHTPLNMIGMPYYNAPLLSAIPHEDWITPHTPLFRPYPPVDPVILANLRIVDRVGYAPNPKTTLRNQALPSLSKAKKGRRADVPHFVSQKDRRDREQSVESIHEGEEERVPQHFRRVEIQYSRFGVEDFDFAFYNKTPFSGLETHIINSYTNSLLQCLHYLLPVRRFAEAHTRLACNKENCLLCETGFLFRMLSDAKGVNCQASNFSRAFTASTQAAALGLMDFEEISQRESYVSLIQTFNRFIIESMGAEAEQPGLPKLSLLRGAPLAENAEGAKTVRGVSPIVELFGLGMRTVSTCFQCQAKTTRDGQSTVLDLIYPRKALSNETATKHQPNSDFVSVLAASVSRETTTKTVCAACRQSTHLRVKRTLVPGDEGMLPPILAINAGVHTPDHVSAWMDTSKGRFLRDRVGLSRSGDGIVVTDESDSAVSATSGEGKVIYELRALTIQVQTEEDPPHLVSLVRIPQSELPAGATSSWYLFNDFLVRSVSEDEALGFPGPWKIPAVLYYQRVDVDTVLDLSRMPTDIDPAIFYADLNISRSRDPAKIKHALLSPEELPKAGTLISIDAEFVSLQDEEVEYRSDAAKRVIRPKRMTLARVSVLRGQGEQTGLPFIDDHIHTSEPIVDYLTEFSGIRVGDLDAMRSPHTLVPLKNAYKKLRLLVDLGCVFIGHGLAKDFRIINIYIPRSQIIDTVDIYHLPERHRKLSLRFLAYAVLHSDVQGGPTHDSIEDARTALQLYEAYERMSAEGKWEESLEDIYREGQKLAFKVPALTAAEEERVRQKKISIPVGSAASQLLPPA